MPCWIESLFWLSPGGEYLLISLASIFSLTGRFGQPMPCHLRSPKPRVASLCSHHFTSWLWSQLSLLSFSWSLEPPSKELRRWESKYSFQMTLYIENSYLPSIFWDFQIVFIDLIITQSPGNSYCSTVPASLSFLHHPLQLRYRSLSVWVFLALIIGL